jgi:hypothetical protein
LDLEARYVLGYDGNNEAANLGASAW